MQQDVEFAVETQLSSILRPGCSAAFPHEVGGGETVAYVAELRSPTDDKAFLRNTCAQVRRVVTEHFQAPLSVVVLVRGYVGNVFVAARVLSSGFR